MVAGERIVVADGRADTAQVAEFERDRRELVRRGLGLGGAVVVAASAIPLLLAVRNAFAGSDSDGRILEQAITLERRAVLAYDTVIGRGLLEGRLEQLVRLLRGHEQQHAAALAKALADLGSEPSEPPGATDVDDAVKGLDDVRTRAGVLSFAIELETAAVAAYYDALSKLIDAKLLQIAASVMASEGQHLVVLRQAARRPLVPNALETGQR